MTTEVAALLVFWVGYLLSVHETAAISLGVVLTIFLASKKTLHHFVREQISETEFEATLRFLAAVLANTLQGPRLLLLLWVVNRGLAQSLALPLLGMAVAGLAGSWLLTRSADKGSEIDFPLENPYSFRAELNFGPFFVVILLLVEVASRWLGDRGILIASGIAGFGNTSAVALSVSEVVGEGSAALFVAKASILVAIATNALSKWILAFLLDFTTAKAIRESLELSTPGGHGLPSLRDLIAAHDPAHQPQPGKAIHYSTGGGDRRVQHDQDGEGALHRCRSRDRLYARGLHAGD
jgi:uncharacterized membrane protein (DUF4010 family)